MNSNSPIDSLRSRLQPHSSSFLRFNVLRTDMLLLITSSLEWSVTQWRSKQQRFQLRAKGKFDQPAAGSSCVRSKQIMARLCPPLMNPVSDGEPGASGGDSALGCVATRVYLSIWEDVLTCLQLFPVVNKVCGS